jgi:hypothetical protein
MVKRLLCIALVGVLAAGAAAAGPERGSAEARLEAVIKRAIHAEGPLLLASERALIERKCGYAPGQWDGNNFNMSNGVLHCSNGRKVDDPEVRAMMDVAGPRIGRRVSAAMARPEVKAAISAVAREASAEAMAELAKERRR